MGQLLRRYWHPIALLGDLTEGQPIKPIQVLSESLVLFRDREGRAGLMQERCTHVSGPMIYGFIDGPGIVCGFHGWTFDVEGNCWQRWYNRFLPVPWARARAYPVQEYGGLYWAYLGSSPAPVLPQYEPLIRADGRRRITVYPVVAQHWRDLEPRPVDLQLSDAAPAPVSPTHIQAAALWLRLPVDDTHTWQIAVDFIAGPTGGPDPSGGDPEILNEG